MNLTVKELLDFIKEHNIPMEAEVLYQRIEDFYFENNNWTTIEKKQDGHPTFYIPAFCPLKYSNDNNLYIDAHY